MNNDKDNELAEGRDVMLFSLGKRRPAAACWRGVVGGNNPTAIVHRTSLRQIAGNFRSDFGLKAVSMGHVSDRIALILAADSIT